jgi:hypothetical protein
MIVIELFAYLARPISLSLKSLKLYNTELVDTDCGSFIFISNIFSSFYNLRSRATSSTFAISKVPKF